MPEDAVKEVIEKKIPAGNYSVDTYGEYSNSVDEKKFDGMFCSIFFVN